MAIINKATKETATAMIRTVVKASWRACAVLDFSENQIRWVLRTVFHFINLLYFETKISTQTNKIIKNSITQHIALDTRIP